MLLEIGTSHKYGYNFISMIYLYHDSWLKMTMILSTPSFAGLYYQYF